MGKKLAIRGHSTRGKEVIELLEMMGGSNIHQYNGEANSYSYYVSSNVILNDRRSIIEDDDFEIFTLEDFLEKYPYKIGDKVIDETGGRPGGVVREMKWDEDVSDMKYHVVFGNGVDFGWYAWMYMSDYNKLSSTVENPGEFKSYTISLKDDKAIGNSIDSVQSVQFVQSGKIVAVRFNTQNYENEVELQLDDYEIVVRDGKTYAVRKKPAYPKTYEECVRIAKNIHGYDINIDAPAYRELLESFVKLLICRDAYWKIAGEEMGLGKPWEPAVQNTISGITRSKDEVEKYSCRYGKTRLLEFPTVKMRDAFYENFKDLIELCKELL